MQSAGNSSNQIVAQVFADCEKVSLQDGKMDKDLFKACFDRTSATVEASHPGAFDFMSDGWNFFMLMFGIFLLYFYVISKKLDEIFVGDGAGKDPIFNIGASFKELGQKLWSIPSGITKAITDAMDKGSK
jgi:ABC-type cobalt transport system substrate-binding protein